MNVQKPACFKLTQPQQQSPSGHFQKCQFGTSLISLCARLETYLRLFLITYFIALFFFVFFFFHILNKGSWLIGRCDVYLSLCSLSWSLLTDWLDDEVTGGEEASLSCKWVSDRLRGLMTVLCFFSQLFFPESMISDSADVNKGMTSSELIKVNCPEIRSSFTAAASNAESTARSVSSGLNDV